MHILWDFDGTLFDTYPSIVDIYQKHLLDKPVNHKELLQLLKISSIEAFKAYQLPEKETREIYLQYEKMITPDQTPPFPGIKKILNWSKKNVIMTHKPRAAVISILHYYNLHDYFDEIVCGDDGFKRKPDIESYQYLHHKHQIDLVIGDRDLDLIPAKKLGISTCIFKNESDYADYTLQNYDDFINVILAEEFNIKVNKKTATPQLNPTFLRDYFSEDDDRYKHILKVVQKSGDTPEAYLHDIGYADKNIITGFHPLDGALFAVKYNFTASVVKPILFHSCAYGESQLRGGELAELYQDFLLFLSDRDKKRIDELTYHDMHTSSTGESVSLDERLEDIFKRYKPDSVVHTNMRVNIPYFKSLKEK